MSKRFRAAWKVLRGEWTAGPHRPAPAFVYQPTQTTTRAAQATTTGTAHYWFTGEG